MCPVLEVRVISAKSKGAECKEELALEKGAREALSSPDELSVKITNNLVKVKRVFILDGSTALNMATEAIGSSFIPFREYCKLQYRAGIL